MGPCKASFQNIPHIWITDFKNRTHAELEPLIFFVDLIVSKQMKPFYIFVEMLRLLIKCLEFEGNTSSSPVTY